MINVGVVGVGFMGMIHYLAYGKAEGIRAAAICSRDENKRRGDWRGIQGNFGPPGEQMDLSGVAAYAELDELLADETVDLVDLCLPPALHADACVRALEAGKSVFCEKPIAVSLEDGRRMVQAAERAGRRLFIGHVLPFFPEYDFALRTIREATYGRLLGGRFKRIISDPAWLKDFYDPEKVGGPLVDLHIHDAHFIRVACGMPWAVFSSGRMRGEVVQFADTQFLYDDGPAVTAAGGTIDQQGRAFTHAYEIHLQRATLLFDFAVLDGQPVTAMPLTVLTADGGVLRPELGSGDPVEGFVREVAEVAASLTEDRPSALLDGALALDALLLCHKQTESVRTGQIVAVQS